MAVKVGKEIAGLKQMTVRELREKYEAVFGEPTRVGNRDWLFKRIVGRVQGIGTGERIIRTSERPAHVAKNRLNLPEELPLDYRIYAAFARGENPLATTETPAEQGE